MPDTLPTADEFFSDQQSKPAPAPAAAPAAPAAPGVVAPAQTAEAAESAPADTDQDLPSGDEFFAPSRAKPYSPSHLLRGTALNTLGRALTPDSDSDNYYRDFMSKTPLGRVIGAYGQAFNEGVPFTEDVQDTLRKAGLYQDLHGGVTGALRTFGLYTFGPAATLAMATFRSLGALPAAIEQAGAEAVSPEVGRGLAAGAEYAIQGMPGAPHAPHLPGERPPLPKETAEHHAAGEAGVATGVATAGVLP